MTQADLREGPGPIDLPGKASRLVALAEAAEIDVEADILRHGGLALVSPDVVLADVGGGVAVFLEGLGEGDRLGSDVLGLLPGNEFRVRFRNGATAGFLPEATQAVDYVDVVVDAARILSR